MLQIGKHRIVMLIALVTFGILFSMTPAIITQSATTLDLSISEIQGDGWSTPYPYYPGYIYVKTTGIVTADLEDEAKKGFFLQDPVGDNNPATSEGIFVYGNWHDVNVGDEVEIVGKVKEYYGLTEIYSTSNLEILSSDNPIPDPIELDPPKDNYASDVYYEALECMLVSVSNMRAVAGTNSYGETAGVRKDLNINRVFEDDPAGTGELIFVDEAGGYQLNARTGNLINGLVGPLDYSFDEYKILPTTNAPPKVIPKKSGIGLGRGQSEGKDLTIASYNMFNLFEDWNADIELAKHARAIHYYLREPDLIAVQEVEKIEMLEQLANTAPIKADYGAVLIEGPDARGIDVGLLYRKDRVEILSVTVKQSCTDLNDAYGPGVDPNYECPDGMNPLFSRPPLVVHLQTINKKQKNTENTELWLIINHFKSKGQYAPYYADTTPRRIEQAEHVSNLVEGIQMNDPTAKVIVVGDLNDFEFSEPLSVLENAGTDGLSNLIFEVNKKNRYTYIYRGVSEVLDHMLITPSLEDDVDEFQIVHFNVDFPHPIYGSDPEFGLCSSDHDIILASLDFD